MDRRTLNMLHDMAGRARDAQKAVNEITGNHELEKLNRRVIDAILAERKRQDEKFGIQRHDSARWMLIAIEELGEVSQANLQGNREAYLNELVQTAAVMVAWLESELATE